MIRRACRLIRWNNRNRWRRRGRSLDVDIRRVGMRKAPHSRLIRKILRKRAVCIFPSVGRDLCRKNVHSFLLFKSKQFGARPNKISSDGDDQKREENLLPCSADFCFHARSRFVDSKLDFSAVYSHYFITSRAKKSRFFKRDVGDFFGLNPCLRTLGSNRFLELVHAGVDDLFRYVQYLLDTLKERTLFGRQLWLLIEVINHLLELFSHR